MIPRVSVLMPLYNCEVHLLASLESLVAQTYTDFEIIAVNDGSTDGTGSMLDAFARREPRCRVIHTENRGIAAALNTAGAAARGEYLARLDGDDIARSDRFAKQVAFLDDETTCVCVGSLSRMIDLFLRLARLGQIDVVQQPLLDYRVHFSSLSARNLERQTESMLCAVLAAIVVKRGGVDPAAMIEMPDRRDYYRVIGDTAFQELFELYGELSLANGAANRMLRGIAVGRLLRLVPRLLATSPRHIADRRFFTLLKATARSAVRLALGKV